MELVPDAFASAAGTVYGHITALANVALVFFLLTIFMHRRNLRAVLVGLLPSGLKVNLIAYLVDAMLIAAPLSYLIANIGPLLNSAGLVLIEPSAFDVLPAFVTGFAAVFVGDLVGYFRHRFEHSRLLWTSHVMHHSDTEMTWLTLYRFHPINRLTTTLIDSSALLLIGFPTWAIVVNGLVRHYYGTFIHANVPWTFGRLGRLFVSPAMHRWHHVRSGPGMHCNFATVFSVFDQAFGTFYLPGPCTAPLGVEGVNDRSYVSQLVLPLSSALGALRRTRIQQPEG